MSSGPVEQFWGLTLIQWCSERGPLYSGLSQIPWKCGSRPSLNGLLQLLSEPNSKQWPQTHIRPPALIPQQVKVIIFQANGQLNTCQIVAVSENVSLKWLTHYNIWWYIAFYLIFSKNAYLIDIFITHLSSCPVFRSFCFCICVLNSKHYKDKIF